MKRIKVLLVFVLSTMIIIQVSAQKGKRFPIMKTESLDKQVYTLPDDAKGKYTLVGVAYSKKAEKQLKTWYQPIYTTFIEESSKNALFSTSYDVNVFFVPMFSGIKKAGYGKAMKLVKKNTDKVLHGNILFFEGSLKTYKKSLNLSKSSQPYLFVLDEHGKVVYTTEGAYSEGKLEAIEELIPEM